MHINCLVFTFWFKKKVKLYYLINIFGSDASINILDLKN